MYKGLMILGGIAIAFNPLTGIYLQGYVVQGWDWLIINAGWIVSVVFLIGLVFVLGVAYAKQAMKDQAKQNKGIAKAKAKKNTKDGLKYEVTA